MLALGSGKQLWDHLLELNKPIRALPFVSGRSAALSSASYHMPLHEEGAEEDQLCVQDRAPALDQAGAQ